MPQFDEEVRAPWLHEEDEAISVRLFRKVDQRVIIYWRSTHHGIHAAKIMGRLCTMLTSWSKPPSKFVRSQFSVRIEVKVIGDNVRAARTVAMDFAQRIAPLLPDYGIGERPSR